MSELSSSPPIVHRHRTAMVRHDLSQPMALLIRHGLLKPGVSVFDYGCGQGDDLRILSAREFTAAGWDPHFLPDARRTPAAVVNLGFVLNVIEDLQERRDALKGAWSLTEKVLAVSTMIVGQVPVGGLRPHADGYLTSRGTFQKYFQHAELRALIAQTLDGHVAAVAPGIFFAFRSPEDEQEFQVNRRMGRRLSTLGYRVPRECRAARPVRPGLQERIPEALTAIADFVRQRGRLPQAEELDALVREELSAQNVSLARAAQTCLDGVLTAEEVEAAAQERREDLLVNHAMGILNRSASLSRPSPGMVRDIRSLFGSQKEVAVQAMQYLHALADETRVRTAIDQAAEAGLGVLDARQRLIADSERTEDLPGVLRCYFGCATFLSGEPDGRYLLRIDPLRRRVTMWPLPDPAAALPVTELSVRIDLRRQDVHVRPDRRRVLRRCDLLGLSPRAKARRTEAAHREKYNLGSDAVFEKLERDD